MGRIVIVGYRPKPGMQERLRDLVRSHVPRLRAEGLATDRVPIAMEAEDGTIVEVFEWQSRAAIEQAHANPAVQQIWSEYAAVCDYVSVGDLAESGRLFSEFTPLDLAARSPASRP